MNDYREKTKLSREVKIQDLSTVENKDTPFYDKKAVISGVFERFPEREDLASLLKKYGVAISENISRQTDYVIAGKGFGPAKMKKVTALQEAG